MTYTSEVRDIPAHLLKIDPKIQRALDRARAGRIAENFTPGALGQLSGTERADGVYLLDGQHRALAAQIAKGDDYPLPVRVFTGLTAQEEARLFRLLNNTEKPSALDLFLVRVVEGEPVATAINNMVRSLGWNVALSAGSFAAVSAAERVYRRSPEAVYLALKAITEAWGYENADGRVFEGIGLVYARYGDQIDPVEMAGRLSQFPGGLLGLLGKGRTLADLIGVSLTRGVAEVVVERYNGQKRSNAVPAWRS